MVVIAALFRSRAALVHFDGGRPAKFARAKNQRFIQ